MIPPHQLLQDEVYLMNLLGHLKLAHERGQAESHEYAIANLRTSAGDAFEALSVGRARTLIPLGPRPRRPDDFRQLRHDLDSAFGGVPTDVRQIVSSTPQQVLDLLEPDEVRGLCEEFGVAEDGIFNRANLDRLARRPEWKLDPARDTPALVRDVVKAATFRIGREQDLLEWVVERLLSPELKSAIRDRKRTDPVEYLRGRSGGGITQAEEEDRRAIQFGYGVLTPLLSFAALDRRLQRLGGHMAQTAEDDLEQCAVYCPDLKESVTLRVGLALELQSAYRKAADILLGTDDPQQDASPAVEATPAPPAPRLADWAQVRVRAEAGASETGPLAGFSAEVEPAKPPARGFKGFFQNLTGGAAAGRERHLVIRSEHQGRELVIARVFGLTAEQEATLQRELPSVDLPADGRPCLDRLRLAPLSGTGRLRAASSLFKLVPKLAARDAEAPPAARLVLARCLEILRPRPLTDADGDLERAITLAAEGAGPGRPLLPIGQTVFEVPGSSEELARELG